MDRSAENSIQFILRDSLLQYRELFLARLPVREYPTGSPGSTVFTMEMVDRMDITGFRDSSSQSGYSPAMSAPW